MDASQLKGVLRNFAAKEAGVPDNEDNKYTVDDYYGDIMYELDSVFRTPQQVSANIVTIEWVEGQDGGEDVFPANGGEVYDVLKVTTDGHEQFFKRTGWYASFSGTEWEKGWKEVQPVTKSYVAYE